MAPIQDVDPKSLASSGWGVIFAPGVGREIEEALRPLLELRKSQAGNFFKAYRYLAGHTKEDFLAAQKAGPGPADPRKVPYYLLIVGSPEEIPFRFQVELDVQYAVGRIHFEEVKDYASYARSVVLAESGAAYDTTLRIWNLQTGEELFCFPHSVALPGCSLAAGGELAMSVADDGVARIWELATGECIVLSEKGSALLCCALSQREHLFAAADYCGRLRVWDLRQKKELRTLDGGSSVPTRCRFSADDRHLLLASRDGLVRMWDLSAETDPVIVARHGDEVNGCAISSDGERIASASHDWTVRLWDREGHLLFVFEEHTGPVRDCAFHPEENLLVSISTDIGVGSTVKVWNPDRGPSLASLRVDGELAVCGWLPGGAALYAAGQYGIYILDWKP